MGRTREAVMLRHLSLTLVWIALFALSPLVSQAPGQLFRRPFRNPPAPSPAPVQPPAPTPAPVPIATAPTAVPAPATPLAPAPGVAELVPTNIRVYYRAKGEYHWRVYGFYLAEPGNRVAQHLTRQGYEVYAQRTTEPIPRVPPRPPDFDVDPAQTVTLAQVETVFRSLATRPDIAYRFPADGCYARAHLMVRHMQKMGLVPYKVWAFANGHDMQVRTPNHPSGEVIWEYHVAPMLRVRGPLGEQHWYVLDPSLFHQPVPLERWEAALSLSPQGFHPYLQITPLGQGVGRPLEGVAHGTGYWPAADPSEGMDAHAAATMRKFKPYEGKLPPKGFPGSVGFAPRRGQAAAVRPAGFIKGE